MTETSDEDYSAEELAAKYCLGLHQARRYIRRFGANRGELDYLLAAAKRTPVHRTQETQRDTDDVTFG